MVVVEVVAAVEVVVVLEVAVPHHDPPYYLLPYDLYHDDCSE